jgi:hypothetical protein
VKDAARSGIAVIPPMIAPLNGAGGHGIQRFFLRVTHVVIVGIVLTPIIRWMMDVGGPNSLLIG